jgi:ubiquinone/menaquinone biosynthesis C-methylase UbiE
MSTKTKLVLFEHKAKYAAYKLISKLGFTKYKELVEGLSRNMTNDRATKKFIRLYGGTEEKAIMEWMGSGKGKSYLDVGAGSGRFSIMALEAGASHVTGIDINEDCLAQLQRLKGREPDFDVISMNARDMARFRDGSFDRVMILGNTLSGMYEDIPGQDKSFQVEVLRELYRVAKEEVFITLQHPGSFRLMLQYYRMNGLELYDYDDKTGVKRVRMRKPGQVLEYRSRHYKEEDIERLLQTAGIPENEYEIKQINDMNWMVRIRKKEAT